MHNLYTQYSIWVKFAKGKVLKDYFPSHFNTVKTH